MAKQTSVHLEITAWKDENGNIKTDCHWGTETKFPHGFATCMTDDEDLGILFQRVRKMITDELKDKAYA